MNKKILLQDLSERMAHRRAISRKDADLFVRSVFEVIGEYLQTDKIVKVKGLGTFKLVTVESRASVDVNTGERIVIKGYTKVSFTPDAVLRDEINKPFAQFETVILNEGTVLEDMERMDAPVSSEQPSSENLSDSEEMYPDTEEEENTQPIVEAEPEMVSVSGNVGVEEAVFETAAIEDEPQNEEPEAEEEPEKEVEVLQEEVVVVEEEKVIDRPEPEEQDTTSKIGTEIVGSAEQRVANQQVEFQKVEHQTVENQHIVQVSPKTADGGSSGSVWTWICVAVVTILLMCGSYYAGHRHLLCGGNCTEPAAVTIEPVHEAKQKPVETDTIKPTVVQDSVVRQEVPSQKTEVKVEPEQVESNSYPQVENGEYEIVGTKAVHKLREGETLRGLSLKYYGSKDYVKYIIVYNEIANPDVVPVNMEFKMPELRLKRR